jgi:ankyrin repeat protein
VPPKYVKNVIYLSYSFFYKKIYKKFYKNILLIKKMVTTAYNTLINACKDGHVDVVKLLLNNDRVDPAADDNDAIQWACRNGHEKVVELLLADGRADPAADNNFAIYWACREGHDKVVKLLVADGRVDPAADNNMAIHWACRKGYDKVVKLLLADGRADPAADNNMAIRKASQNGRVKVVKLLLEDRRVDPAADNNEAIQWACRNGRDKVVEALFRSSKNVRMYLKENNPVKFNVYNAKVEKELNDMATNFYRFVPYNIIDMLIENSNQALLSIISDRTETGREKLLKQMRNFIRNCILQNRGEPIPNNVNIPKKARTSGAAKICQKCNLPIVSFFYKNI